jgi:hypothetical protein
MMKRRSTLSVLALLGIGALASNATAQQPSLAQQLIGTWSVVSVADVYDNGNKVEDWGAKVGGAASFDGNGHFTYMLIGSDLDKPSGSPRVSSRFVVAYYGKYTVDEANKTITYSAERSTYPGFDGGTRQASVILDGDQMTQNSRLIGTPRGGFVPQVVFKRAK